MSNRDLVVIGGSAGSIGPLRTILGALPADLPAAVVVALHIPAASTGIFNSVAAAAGKLPVVAAEDGMPLVTGHVHLAVPNRHLIVEGDMLRLGAGPRENLVRPAIDPLFRSAAISHGPRAVGVILSGRLNDGADGLRAIKRCGGVALVQAPQDCTAAEMPLAALEATSVDMSLEAAGLGAAIIRFVRERAEPAGPAPKDIVLEVEIAQGGRCDSGVAGRIAVPVPLTYPSCGGVLSQVSGAHPLRFRCEVGHGYTASTLAHQQEDSVDKALRVALRIVGERAELIARMARDAAAAGRAGMAEMYASRAEEYRAYAETLKSAVLKTLEKSPRGPDEEQVVRAQVIGPDVEAG